jgi:O-acetyl-ADP-ribose deacetylase (regulator of RNase III)
MKKVQGNLVDIIQDGGLEKDTLASVGILTTLLVPMTVVVQGCNCQCAGKANGGLAGVFNREFPVTMEADMLTIPGNAHKMGSYSTTFTHGCLVLNAYTQFRGGRDLNIVALRNCFEKINRDFTGEDVVIVFADIGCGIAGGCWDQAHFDKNLGTHQEFEEGVEFLSDVIEGALTDVDHVFVEFA